MTNGNLLPDGWTVVPLGELGTWGSGGTPPRTNPDFYTESGIPWLVIGDLNDATVHKAKNHITESGLKNSAAKLLNPGTLLVAMYGSIGKLGITGMPCATNQAIASCNPISELVTLKFLYYTLKNEQPALVAQGQGGAQQNISQTILKAHPVPLPPLPEQIRIADKLDTLLARVDAGRERLERVPRLIKQFRRAVLSAAMSGDLTRDWRGGGDPQWDETTIGSLATDIRYGTAQKCDYDASGTPVLRIPNVNGGQINTDDLKFGKFEEKELKKLVLRAGDILMIRSNGSADLVGQPALVGEEHEGYLFAGYLIRLRLRDEASPEFVWHRLSAPDVRGAIETSARSSSGVHNINAEEIREITFDLPPLPEQAEIVRRVEALFAIADRLETRYRAALTSFDRLTPALLAKAFRGELVPQDPDDEPASVLLERIRAQRAAEGPKPKRGRQLKAAAQEGDAEPKRRGRPPKAGAEGAEAGEPKRRSRPPGARGEPAIPQASSYEDAVRQLEAKTAVRAQEDLERAPGRRQVGLFEE